MRPAWVEGRVALAERLAGKRQIVDDAAPERELPPYLESFLAHLRLLVGVPFTYLVPDARLLPPESVRFFYLDRSWTDRLVDGAMAVGKIGSREQAHHHGVHPLVAGQLDLSERMVRRLQRRTDFAAAKQGLDADARPAGTITGLLLRSALVSGWPHLDVRAFDTVLQANPSADDAEAHRIRSLRIERLSRSVLIALFDGIPQLVWLEEPHHGVQLGPVKGEDGRIVRPRRADGIADPNRQIPIPSRAADASVVDVRELRRRLQAAAAVPAQTGSAALALELLQVPWRQRFQNADAPSGVAAFQPTIRIADTVARLNVTVMKKAIGGDVDA